MRFWVDVHPNWPLAHGHPSHSEIAQITLRKIEKWPSCQDDTNHTILHIYIYITWYCWLKKKKQEPQLCEVSSDPPPALLRFFSSVGASVFEAQFAAPGGNWEIWGVPARHGAIQIAGWLVNAKKNHENIWNRGLSDKSARATPSHPPLIEWDFPHDEPETTIREIWKIRNDRVSWQVFTWNSWLPQDIMEILWPMTSPWSPTLEALGSPFPLVRLEKPLVRSQVPSWPNKMLLQRLLTFSRPMLYNLTWYNSWLVVSTPLKNMKVSWDDYSQYMGK